MLVKFLQGEYIFDENGLGVGDEAGAHKKATEETFIEIHDDKVSFVLAYLEFDRAQRGLDLEGNPPPVLKEISEVGVENGV